MVWLCWVIVRLDPINRLGGSPRPNRDPDTCLLAANYETAGKGSFQKRGLLCGPVLLTGWLSPTPQSLGRSSVRKSHALDPDPSRFPLPHPENNSDPSGTRSPEHWRRLWGPAKMDFMLGPVKGDDKGEPRGEEMVPKSGRVASVASSRERTRSPYGNPSSLRAPTRGNPLEEQRTPPTSSEARAFPISSKEREKPSKEPLQTHPELPIGVREPRRKQGSAKKTARSRNLHPTSDKTYHGGKPRRQPERPRRRRQPVIMGAILEVRLPKHFDKPTDMRYDGTQDPQEHLTAFEARMNLEGVGDEVRCRAFPVTLAGLAIRWFNSLPQGSVTTFADITCAFLAQFTTRIAKAKHPINLLGVTENWRADQEVPG
ncbi:uncharacterized protein DS421_11g321420 [Arachis hypogaea]|nr:uncharacterized protein DS421_11g321420 [Arachis hypogaea]